MLSYHKTTGICLFEASTDRASVVNLLVFSVLALLLCFAVTKLNSLPIPPQIESLLFSTALHNKARGRAGAMGGVYVIRICTVTHTG